MPIEATGHMGYDTVAAVRLQRIGKETPLKVR